MSRGLFVAVTCICAMVAIAGGCFLISDQQVDSLSIIGTYQSVDGNSISRIHLQSDGSYVHSYIHNGSTESNSGAWSLDKTGDGDQLSLGNANFFPGEIKDRCNAHGGYCLLRVRSFLGRTSLVYDIDLGLAFQKIPSHSVAERASNIRN